MEVADTEAAVTLAVVTLVGGTSEAGAVCTLEGAMCMLAGLMCTLAVIASPEAATSGIMAAVGLAGGVMADSPATRTAGLIRTATGRSELKPMGVLNVHLASHESKRLFSSVPGR
jgi:hypothetical protein